MAKKKITDKNKPHCLRDGCGWHDEGSTDCRTYGWWSTEFELRKKLPFKMDPKTGLMRKYVGKRIQT